MTGNPLPTVQWYKNETNIDDSPDYAITYNNGEAVLKFHELVSEDSAVYTCKATNRLGQISTSARLDVEVSIPEEKSQEVIVPTVLENGVSNVTPEPMLESKIEKTSAFHHNEIIQEQIIRESKLVTVSFFLC